jgi:hypothetical protein
MSGKNAVKAGRFSTEDGNTRLGPCAPKRPANRDKTGAGLVLMAIGAGREEEGASSRQRIVGKSSLGV